eukprot:Skav234125  [mRNA]  locus=scaffold753:120655:128308:- [translate_table: standard]
MVWARSVPVAEEAVTQKYFTSCSAAPKTAICRRNMAALGKAGDIWTLLAGFFAFYAGYDGPTGHGFPFVWGKEVVSVRLGQRSRKLHCAHSSEFHDLKGRQEGHLHIEDPVEQSRNLRDVLRSHPVDHETVLMSELRLMDSQCRLQAQAMICQGQIPMWDKTQPDFAPLPSMPFGLHAPLVPVFPMVPQLPPPPVWPPSFPLMTTAMSNANMKNSRQCARQTEGF